jgi:hypothetical protein
MSKRLAAGLLILACVTSGARAASLDMPPPSAWGPPPPDEIAVPAPNLIPLPGTIEPHYEIGARYWWSEGRTKSSANANAYDYDNAQGNAAEFVFRARTESNWFAKGFVGAGSLSSGTLDATLGGASFSNINLDGNNLVYGTLDVGKRFTLSEGITRVTFGPFIGFNLWQENIDTGTTLSPNVLFHSNDVGWAALRLGGELQVKLFDRFTLIGDAAALPAAFLVNDEGSDRQNSGPGWGYQLEAQLRVDLTPCWSLGSGVRYWYADVTNGSSKFNHGNEETNLTDFTTQRFGVFGDVSYKF